MTATANKVQLTDTINYQRLQINNIIDDISSTTGSSIITVATEADLPAVAAAQSNAYIIKQHSLFGGSTFACIIDSTWKYAPLKSDVMNANSFIYVNANELDTSGGVTANKAVYLDSITGLWKLADPTDENKYAVGIVGNNSGYIIIAGSYYNSSLSLLKGVTYYYDTTGSLTTTATNGIIGTAVSTNSIAIHIQHPRDKQSDWGQTDSTKSDYIKNKPSTVSKDAMGFAPQLPNEETVSKFLRQDGTWSVPSTASTTTTGYCPQLSGDVDQALNGTGGWTSVVKSTGDTMDSYLSDVTAAQLRNIQILTEEQSSGVDGTLYAVIEEY